MNVTNNNCKLIENNKTKCTNNRGNQAEQSLSISEDKVTLTGTEDRKDEKLWGKIRSELKACMNFAKKNPKSTAAVSGGMGFLVGAAIGGKGKVNDLESQKARLEKDTLKLESDVAKLGKKSGHSKLRNLIVNAPETLVYCGGMGAMSSMFAMVFGLSTIATIGVGGVVTIGLSALYLSLPD
ncbi:MAG: hypothetical protein K8T10_21380 [Candidatus Eremiobacteraeota bacterium]|nr:hypothetical protein [Candidatus Eremiobacteraeota bacterium]